MTELSDLELGWLAGIFEGEGCIYITPDGRTVRLTVPSIDRDTVDRVQALTGIGNIHTYDYKVSSGDIHVGHRWQAQRLLEVQALLRLLRPHLGLRRGAKADEALAIEPNPNGFGPRTLRTHCKRGHEFTEENTIRASDGGRRCRACRNMRALRRYHETKAPS